jgi:hypothetical protein
MCTLYDIADFSGQITEAEVCKAISGARAKLADGVLTKAYNELYKLSKNPCAPSDSNGIYCLFLYLYALDSVDFEGDNFLNEEQLASLLTSVEQISKTCCCDE